MLLFAWLQLYEFYEFLCLSCKQRRQYRYLTHCCTTRVKCHPIVGLEAATIQRKLKLEGRNIVSPPLGRLKALNL